MNTSIQDQDDVYTCPSFSSYTRDKLSETAVRVTTTDITTDNDFEFPVFNRDISLNNTSSVNNLIPLSQLFLEDRLNHDDPHSSCSSSEDEHDRCVWRPKIISNSPVPSQCKKSKSTGSTSSKRWKIPDFLKRSNSEGKGNFVFVTMKKKSKKLVEVEKGKGKGAASAHEELYVRNRAMKEGDRKKSYLPYRQDLVGFFANNVSGLGKSFTRF